MPKRPREATESDDERDGDGGVAAANGPSNTNSGGGMSGGGEMSRIQRPIKPLHNDVHHYTKKFYMKIYANDWLVKNIPNAGNVVCGYATVLPVNELCMYLSPHEFIDILKQSHYAKLNQCDMEVRLKAVRTPFNANTTDITEANGNLQFEIKRWDGLEQMLPFDVVDVAENGDILSIPDNSELITRLYGTSLSSLVGDDNDKLPATMRERGLSWRPMWYFEKFPQGTQHYFTGAGSGTHLGNPYLNNCISSLPIGEFECESVNTNSSKMTEGHIFKISRKPKNGILSFQPSAWKPYQTKDLTGTTAINQKILMKESQLNYDKFPNQNENQYQSLFGSAGPNKNGIIKLETNDQVIHDVVKVTSDQNLQGSTKSKEKSFNEASNVHVVQLDTDTEQNAGFPIGLVWGNDDQSNQAISYDGTGLNVNGAYLVADNPEITASYGLGYGYNQYFNQYLTAKIENYQQHTSRNDPPIHHLQSCMIGVVPKTTRDKKIVPATIELEITTHCSVSMNNADVTYFNLGISAKGDYLDPTVKAIFPTPDDILRTNFHHNETDISLYTDQYWTGNYGQAAKPLFKSINLSNPLKK